MQNESKIDHTKNQTLINQIQVDYQKQPAAIFLVGGNGGGKSSLRKYLDLSDIQMNIDPDSLNRILKQSDPKHYLIKSARQALQMYDSALNHRWNVCMESTLSGQGTMHRILSAKKAGYQVMAYFVGLRDVALNFERIRYRVTQGGHDIDAHIVRKRYCESIQNLQKMIQMKALDCLYVIDNSLDYYRLQYALIQFKITRKSRFLEKWAQKICYDCK